MALIAPFRGLRYDLSRVGDPSGILAPPYDVISETERSALEGRHPQNVVRVELPRGEGDAKYANARALLDQWTADGVLRLDDKPALYRYEQTFSYAGRSYTRRGFVALVKLEPFATRTILPHEKTLSAPKADRLKLMRATSTHISQVFGLYRDPEGLAERALDAGTGAPALDGTTADGCRHRLWVVTDPAAIAGAAEVLKDKSVMIADGHHRYETMVALRDELRPAEMPAGRSAADWGAIFLARAEDPGLLVLPTHRMVNGLASFDPEQMRSRAASAFEVSLGTETTRAAIEERLARETEARGGRPVFAVRVAGESGTTWLAQRADADLSPLGPPALRGLDVTVLHGIVLGPILGIDAEALARQSFLTYTHDTDEALGQVSGGRVQAAFMMNATKVHQVLAACEAGFVLPQKSTYFQPKLATGLVMYKIDPRAEVASIGPQAGGR